MIGNSHSVLGVSRVVYDVTSWSGSSVKLLKGNCVGVKVTAAGVIGVTGLARVCPSVKVADEAMTALLEIVKSSVSCDLTSVEMFDVKACAVVWLDKSTVETDTTAMVILGVGKKASDTT